MAQSVDRRTVKARKSSEFTTRFPDDVIRALEHVARSRGVSCEALVAEYVGTGLRSDLDRLFSDNLIPALSEELQKRELDTSEVEALVAEVVAKARPWATGPKPWGN